MPDCTELQNAVDAIVAIIDGNIAIFDERVMALEQCLMGEFEQAAMNHLDSVQNKLKACVSRITEIKAAILNGEGTNPAIDEGGAGPAPDGDSGGSAAAP